MIHSDLHLHSEYSYDSALPLAEILAAAKERGYRQVGITDHLNLPNHKFINCLRASAENVLRAKEAEPSLPLLLGVELTPIEKPFFDFCVKYPETESYNPPGYTPPTSGIAIPYPYEMAMTKEELMSYGVQYAVCAAHGYIDTPAPDVRSIKDCVDAWYRMHMYLACDERTTILGHPYYHGLHLWYQDFSVVPYSVHEELAAALKEKNKLIEMNLDMIVNAHASERFKHQYAEYMRYMFEAGVRVTYGSDSHNKYPDNREKLYPYLEAVGFRDGDFSELSPADLWQ